MKIRTTEDCNDLDWLSLRSGFIPELSEPEHRDFLQRFSRESSGFQAFIAHDESGKATGFAEVSIRRDYVNGCRYRPALFLEGIFVLPECRGQGIARAVCEEAERWGLEQGCKEFASDVYIDDNDSLAAHAGLGFVEAERVVCLSKPLAPGGSEK